MDIAELDALPVAIRELILAKHYWAIHAVSLQRALLDPPRTMDSALWWPRPTADAPDRGFYTFSHALPSPSFWYRQHDLPAPKNMITARGYQVDEFRRRYFDKNIACHGFQVSHTPVYPHHDRHQKKDAEILAEITKRDAERLI
jgi:hypothetical protein